MMLLPQVTVLYIHCYILSFCDVVMKYGRRWRSDTSVIQIITLRKWIELVWLVVLWLSGPLHR